MDEIKRGDFPPLKAPDLNAAGGTLTREMVDNLFARLTSPEFREQQRREEEHRFALMDEMNRQLKASWARRLGKTVGELTGADMAALNEACFQSWLKYQGVTEEEFWEWIG